MSHAQLTDANAVLASPPPVGLELTRSLGFTVIGRLAARFGVGVRLTSTPGAGVVAAVHLPTHLVVIEEPSAEPAFTPAERAWEPEWLDEARVDDMGDDEEHEPLEPAPAVVGVAAEAGPVDGVDAVPSTLEQALPQGSRFDQGLANLLRGDERPVPSPLIEPTIALQPGVTAAGLTRRQPKLSRRDGESVRAGEPSGPAIAPGRRSPEQVRELLARYRTGLQRGRTSDDQEPENEEPS